MQKMVDICNEEIRELNLKLNTKKTFAIRIGRRFKTDCANLLVNNFSIAYSSSIKYLGVTIKAGTHFVCKYEQVKISFYRAFNSLYVKSKSAYSELISIHLLKAYCLPLILYALEATMPNKSSLLSLDHLIHRAVGNFFNLVETDNINFVRASINLCNIRLLVLASVGNFIINFCKRNTCFTDIVTKLSMNRLSPILREYNVNDDSAITLQMFELVSKVRAMRDDVRPTVISIG
jgi:hypothetical protein